MNDRLPPHAPEMEQCVLSCCLQDNSCIDACAATLARSGDAFYDLRHRAIYSAMVQMRENSLPVDLVSLMQHLKDTNLLEQIGGVPFLAAVADAAPSAANLRYFLGIVTDKHLMRRMIQVCTESIARVYDFEGEIDTLLDELERDVLAIQPARQSDAPTVKELVRQSIETIERLWQSQGELEGIPTGFVDLDRMTGGLKPGEMTVIAGYPGAGKTSFAMNLAEHAMLEAKRKVGVFSLEMSSTQLVTRFLCSHARVNLRHIKNGVLTESDFPRLTNSAGKISSAAIYFEDESDLSIHQLRAKARRLHQQHGIEMLVVDYLQLLSATGGSRKVESRQQEVADISRGLKAISRELRIPVIGLSQLNDDGKLRESRAIGQDADNVWVLKEKAREEDGCEQADASEVDLRIVKARNGPVGTVSLTFIKQFTRFESAARV